ncbi:MAG: protein translocase subunit SecF, partial [Acidimicrobiales bacterium]
MSTDTADLVVETRHHGLFRRLYYGQTRFDFVRRKRIWFGVSALLILAGVISMAVQGLNFDIEFVGGTSWQVPANGATVTQARNALTPEGLGGATITMLGSGAHQTIQVEARLPSSGQGVSNADATIVQRALANVTHHSNLNSVSIEQVGPTWGAQITQKAIIALIVFFVLIALYISIFFDWKMALGAIVAVAHDILITVGIYSITFFLVTPDTVVAFLTILGYSLYDTIVVFDRIRDNKGLAATGKLTYTDVVNLSMNQTLARSINTSLVAIMPILAVLVLGADILGATTLEYFGLALLIGLTSGAYSSIFIASPLVAFLREREGRYAQIRNRLEARGDAKRLLSAASLAAGALQVNDGTAPVSGSRRGGRRRPQARQGTLRSGAAPGVTAPAARSGPLRPKAAGQPPAVAASGQKHDYELAGDGPPGHPAEAGRSRGEPAKVPSASENGHSLDAGAGATAGGLEAPARSHSAPAKGRPGAQPGSTGHRTGT